MGVAYFIVAEKEVEGLDTFVNGKSLARCRYLDGLARAAGVRPLMDFFSMNTGDAESFLDSLDQEPPPQGFAPEQWCEADEGLRTVRGLLSRLVKGPIDLPDDPIPEDMAEFVVDLPAPEIADVIEDLREFECVLARLASERVRWHLAVDF